MYLSIYTVVYFCTCTVTYFMYLCTFTVILSASNLKSAFLKTHGYNIHSHYWHIHTYLYIIPIVISTVRIIV